MKRFWSLTALLCLFTACDGFQNFLNNKVDNGQKDTVAVSGGKLVHGITVTTSGSNGAICSRLDYHYNGGGSPVGFELYHGTPQSDNWSLIYTATKDYADDKIIWNIVYTEGEVDSYVQEYGDDGLPMYDADGKLLTFTDNHISKVCNRWSSIVWQNGDLVSLVPSYESDRGYSYSYAYSDAEDLMGLSAMFLSVSAIAAEGAFIMSAQTHGLWPSASAHLPLEGKVTDPNSGALVSEFSNDYSLDGEGYVNQITLHYKRYSEDGDEETTSIYDIDYTGKDSPSAGNTDDTLHDEDEPSDYVTFITLLGDRHLLMNEGESRTLTYGIEPRSALDKSVTWSSSNPSVASVDDSGLVKALSVGIATITASANDGSGKSGNSFICAYSFKTPEAIDMGLSVKWASFNVGATAPEENGTYYSWGETELKTRFNWKTDPLVIQTNDVTTHTSYISILKYNTQEKYGDIDNKTMLESGPEGDDVASKLFGNGWRIPTYEEWEELIENCTWTWTTRNGAYGELGVSKKNGNSIFLPACGSWGAESPKYGYYWSSSVNQDDPQYARHCSFPLGERSDSLTLESSSRCVGFTVRPVSEKN